MVWAWGLFVVRLFCCGLPAPARRQFFAQRFVTVRHDSDSYLFLLSSFKLVSFSCPQTNQVLNDQKNPDRHAKNLKTGKEHTPDCKKTLVGSLLTRHRPARPHTTHRPPRPPPSAPPGPRTQLETEEPAPRLLPRGPRPGPGALPAPRNPEEKIQNRPRKNHGRKPPHALPPSTPAYGTPLRDSQEAGRPQACACIERIDTFNDKQSQIAERKTGDGRGPGDCSKEAA